MSPDRQTTIIRSDAITPQIPMLVRWLETNVGVFRKDWSMVVCRYSQIAVVTTFNPEHAQHLALAWSGS